MPSPKPRISQEQLARELGISRATVSYVLNGRAQENRVSPETAEKVLELAGKMGYVPNLLAKSLKRQRTGIIGVVVINFTMDWAQKVYSGVERALAGLDVTPIFVQRGVDPVAERKELEWMLHHRVDGVIVCIPMQENRDYYPTLTRRGMPLVFMGELPVGAARQSSFVLWDSPKAVTVLVDRLVASGRRRLVWATYGHQEVMSKARYIAYRESVRQAGVEIDESTHLVIDLQRDLDRVHQVVRAWLVELFEGPRPAPEAIVCIVDVLASIVLEELKEMGISVPQEVVVTGVGDFPLMGSSYDQLITVREPTAELGRLSAQALMDLIADPKLPPIQQVIQHVEILDRPGVLDVDATLDPIARDSSALATTLQRSLV